MIRSGCKGARGAFERAFAANPLDARVLYERDQLWKRTGESRISTVGTQLSPPPLRLRAMTWPWNVATCIPRIGPPQPDQALHLLLNRKFQPWEGGEGLVLEQYTRSLLCLESAHWQKAIPRARAVLRPRLASSRKPRRGKTSAREPEQYLVLDRRQLSVENQPDEALDAWKHAGGVRSDFRR